MYARRVIMQSLKSIRLAEVDNFFQTKFWTKKLIPDVIDSYHIRKQSTTDCFIRKSHELTYRFAVESTRPLFVPPRTFSLVRHWKRWGLQQACCRPRKDDGENKLVQPGFVLPLAWDENLLSPQERIVSALCCVWMERSGVFLVFPAVQAHCGSPTGRSSTGSSAPRPYNDWTRAVACSVQHWAWSTLPVRSLSRCSLPLLWRSSTQLLQLRSWPWTQRPSRVGSWATWSANDILVGGLCLKMCSCRLKIETSRGECQALRAQPEGRVC